MYTMINSMPLRRLVFVETIPFGIAIFIAEIFYKFHSFTLECLAFLATWFVVSWISSKVGNVYS